MSASPETSARSLANVVFRLRRPRRGVRNERRALRHPRRAWRTERLARDIRKKLSEINASRETSAENQYFVCFAWDFRHYACDATVSLETSTESLDKYATDRIRPPADREEYSLPCRWLAGKIVQCGFRASGGGVRIWARPPEE